MATAPNQVWTWDITYLKSPVLGMFFYLYLVVDIFNRKIVGAAVHDAEGSEQAAEMIMEACAAEGIDPDEAWSSERLLMWLCGFAIQHRTLRGDRSIHSV